MELWPYDICHRNILCTTNPTWKAMGLKSDLYSRNQHLTPLAVAQSPMIKRAAQQSLSLYSSIFTITLLFETV
jgi:hypothetical protein